MSRTSPKGMALGSQIRAARVAAGVGVRELAKRVGVDHSTLSRAESGERPPSPDLVSMILIELGVDGSEVQRIIDMSRDTTGSVWLAISLPEQRAQLAALLDFEQMATSIFDNAPLLVPGLLQTGAYARAIMRSAGVPHDEVETRVAVRVGRRDILIRRQPVQLTAVVGENVLRQMVGGPQVMAEQLDHLLQMAELPNVDLRAMSSEVGWHPGLEGMFVILDVDQETSLVHVENRRSGLFLREEEDLAAYKRAAEKMLSVAMSPVQTTELIAREAERIKRIE